MTASYYGKPIVKEPVWSNEIPWYFFTGGIAGASALLHGFARLTGNRGLARSSLFVGAACDVVVVGHLRGERPESAAVRAMSQRVALHERVAPAPEAGQRRDAVEAVPLALDDARAHELDHGPHDLVHHAMHAVHGGVQGWVVETLISAAIGTVVGAAVLAVRHLLPSRD